MEKDNERARNQARAQFESIQEMVNKLHSEDEGERSEGIDEINEDPLEISVRSDWHSPSEKGENTEYLILLCTGGPAVRIIGDLNQYGEPERARLQFQDWFTEWEELILTHDEYETLLEYARSFYFGN